MFAPRMARLCRARVLPPPRQNVAVVVRAEINATRTKTTKTIAGRNKATAPVANTTKARVGVTAALARTPGRRDRDESSEAGAANAEADAEYIETLKAELAQANWKCNAAQRRAAAAGARNETLTAELDQVCRELAAAKRREADTKAQLEPHQDLSWQGFTVYEYRYITLNHPLPENCPGGGYTDVNWSCYPSSVVDWEEWDELLREESHVLQEAVGQKPFPISTRDLQRKGEEVKKMQLGPEQADVEFLNLRLTYVKILVNKALENDKMKARYKCPSSITSSKSYTDFMAPESYEAVRQLHPDGVMKRTGERGCFLVYEVKAGHKFPSAVLKAHLANKNLFADVAAEVHHRRQLKESGQTPKKRSPEEALRFGVASVGQQVRSYMLHCGVEYGFLSAGNTIVLFHFRKENPKILYHKVLEPHVHLPDVPPGEWTKEQLRYTPVNQLSCFQLVALKADPPRGREYKEMMRQAGDHIWPDRRDDDDNDTTTDPTTTS